MLGQLSEDAKESVRQVSKSLLGNRLRLELAALIAQAEPDVVFGRQLSRELRIGDNQALSELRRLRDAGLLDELPAVEGQTRIYFRRRASVFWDFALHMVDEIRRGHESPRN